MSVTVPRLEVDFNDIEDDAIEVLIEDVAPAIGDLVLLADGEGNSCFGRLRSFAVPRVALVDCIWDTWRSMFHQEVELTRDEWRHLQWYSEARGLTYEAVIHEALAKLPRFLVTTDNDQAINA